MKKTHRAVLSILLVLTLLATLPLTAMADTQTVPDNTTVSPPMDVTTDQEMENNTGTIGTNGGTITNNGVAPAEGQKADPTSGTVEKNQYDGKIENNYGTVVENGNSSGAPQIINNYGTVKTNSSGNQGEDRKAGIVTNYGLVEENYRSGVVGKNAQGGTVQTNYGWVGYNNYDDGARVEGVGNAGEVTNNYGLVFNEGGTVVNNYAQAADGGPAIVDNYSGTVVNNYGYVYGYDETKAKVTNNYGYVEGGTVETNDVGGWVEDTAIGHCTENWEWVPDSLLESTVTTNYGTHVKYANVDDYNNDNGGTYYYGVHFVENGEKVYLGSYENDREVTLGELNDYAKKQGYKITDIQEVKDYSWEAKDFVAHNEVASQNGDGTEETPGTTPMTRFRISAPTWLQLTWEKIASIFTPAASTDSSSGGAEVVELSAGKRYIGLGSVIFINEKGYKVVEIKDDAYVVVSFDALSDEDVQDLDALFAKLFTPEQQKLIKNVGQLLDSEDVLAVFGTPGNHPVYEISKDLVK